MKIHKQFLYRKKKKKPVIVPFEMVIGPTTTGGEYNRFNAPETHHQIYNYGIFC